MPVSERYDEDVEPTAKAATGSAGRHVIAAIGIDHYQHWPALSNAVRDATGAVALFQRLGFEEIAAPLLGDRATGKAIQSLVTDDLMVLEPDDSLVLFYAGHGGTRKHRLGDEVVKAGYLIPVDAAASPDKASTWVDLEGWLRVVSLLPARHILVVLDACHSGIALDPIIKWRDIGSWQEAPLPALQARRSRRIITSALDDQVALDSGPVHGHSLFTGCLLEGLSGGIRGDRGAVTTGSELGLYVQRRVQTYPGARQTPDFGTFAFDDRGEMAIPLAIERVLQRPWGPATAMASSAWLDLIDLDDPPQLVSGAESQSSTAASGTGAGADRPTFGEPGPTPPGVSADGVEPASRAEARPHDLAVDDADTLDSRADPASGVAGEVAGASSAPGPSPHTLARSPNDATSMAPRSEPAQPSTELVPTPGPRLPRHSTPILLPQPPPAETAKPGAPTSDVRRKMVLGVVVVGATLAITLIALAILGQTWSQLDARLRGPASNPPDGPVVGAGSGVTVGGPPDAQPPSAGAPAGDCPAGMVRVPAGTFQMGSLQGGGDTEEHPQHEVTLWAYCIDRTEVTVKAYAACVAAEGCSAAPLTVQWSGYSAEDVQRYSRFCNREDRPDHPINCVDWNQAVAYCTWAGKRLPTEAEWEYAARGTDGRAYPWGNETPSATRLNACGGECVAMAERELDADWRNDWRKMYDASDRWETTAPVGSFPDGASPFGALDMAGNVWEWTADWYGDYSGTPATNPRGAKTGTARVLRGGAWSDNNAGHVRAAYRSGHGASYRDLDAGFRCARGD